jgi:hypothetical protein
MIFREKCQLPKRSFLSKNVLENADIEEYGNETESKQGKKTNVIVSKMQNQVNGNFCKAILK